MSDLKRSAKMKTLTHFLLLPLLVLTACANPATQNTFRIQAREPDFGNSPFQWQHYGAITYFGMNPLLSGPTKVDSWSEKKIMKLIAKAEAEAKRPEPKIIDIKLVKDGREVWVLEKGGREALAYIISSDRSESGGSDYVITGPLEYGR
jgi:hypothetical protein